MVEEFPSNRPTVIDEEEFQSSSSDSGEEKPSTSNSRLPLLDDNATEDLKQALRDSETQDSVLPILKHELKYKILYRRHSEGKGDVDLTEEPKIYELSEEEIQRKETRRKRNRESAERVKQRELDLEIKLKKKIDRLSHENTKLTNMRIKLLRNRREILSELREFGCVPHGVKCTCERNIEIISESTTSTEIPSSSNEKHLVLITRKDDVPISKEAGNKVQSQNKSEQKSDKESESLKYSHDHEGKNTNQDIVKQIKLINDQETFHHGSDVEEQDEGKFMAKTSSVTYDPDSSLTASSVISEDREEDKDGDYLHEKDEILQDTTFSSDEEYPLLIDESIE